MCPHVPRPTVSKAPSVSSVRKSQRFHAPMCAYMFPMCTQLRVISSVHIRLWFYKFRCASICPGAQQPTDPQVLPCLLSACGLPCSHVSTTPTCFHGSPVSPYAASPSPEHRCRRDSGMQSTVPQHRQSGCCRPAGCPSTQT